MDRVRHPRLRAGVIGLAAIVVASCSVSTPRDGFTDVATGSGARGRESEQLRVGPAGDTATTISGGEIGGDVAGAGGADSGTVGGQPTGGSAAPTGGDAAAGTGGAGAPASDADAPAAPVAPTVGVTDKTITISVLAGYSGQYGPIIQTVVDNGFMVWVEDVNARGGINGRRIDAKKVDHRDSVEGAVAACKSVQNNGSFMAVFVVGLAGSDTAIADCLNKAGVTLFANNLSVYSPEWTNVYVPVSPNKLGVAVASFVRNALGVRDKIGVLYAQNEPPARSSRDGFVDGLKELGLKPHHEEAVRAGQGSYVAELNRMRASGATAVGLAVSSGDAVNVLRDAKAIGYAPKWGSLFFWVSDEFARAGGELFRGIKAVRHYASADSPAYQQYTAKARAQGRSGLINSTTMALYGEGLLTGKMLENAGRTPTRESLHAGIEAVVNYDDGIHHLSFGKGVHVAELGVWPIECCREDGTWRGTGPARSRF